MNELKVKDHLPAISPTGTLAIAMENLTEDAKRFSGFFANLRSDLTRIEYERTLKEFFSLFAGEIHHPGDIKKHHVAYYRNYLDTKNAPNTVNKKMSALSSFCKYLADPNVGLLDHNPCFGVIRAEAEVVKETAALTKQQVKSVFQTLDPSKYNFFFNRAFLAIGFYGGLRVREICNLQRKHLGSENGVRVLRFKGKKRAIRKVSLHPVANLYIEEHIEDLRRRGFDVESSEQYLFPNLRNPTQTKPITVQAGEDLFKKHVKLAGFVAADDIRRFSSHSMRGTFATRLAELQVPLEEIQRELGHARPETTQVYIKTNKSAESSPVFRLDY